MIASQSPLSRLITGCLVAALAVSGVAPCGAAVVVSAASDHDCCDPGQVETDSGIPPSASLAAGLPDCCVASADTRTPQVPPAARHAELDQRACTPALVTPSPFAAPMSPSRDDLRDHRARSAPRPSLVTVLLI